jgi:alanine racemase
MAVDRSTFPRMRPDSHPSRRAVATIDLAAIEANLCALAARLTGGARLCAVVKADAYGHGAPQVARAALAAGADMLAVATAAEAARLREEGIGARVLVLGPLTAEDFARANAAGAEVVAWWESFVRSIATSAARVHVKLDSGMGRLGTRDPATATRVAEIVRAEPGLELVGAMTHLATADDRHSPFALRQLEQFKSWALSSEGD